MADIIVIGSSAGGVEALRQIVGELDDDLPASLFIVQHVAPDSPFLLPQILDRDSPLPVAAAVDGEAIRPGRILLAPPDQHLLLNEHHVRLRRGPHENRSRPAIDPLFRSAAATFNGRAAGVVLTGLLNDGSSGLLAIRRCGGVTIVQEPGDADFPEMPRNAFAAAAPEHCVPLAEIASLVNRLAREPARPGVIIPTDILLEVAMAEGRPAGTETREQMGVPSVFGCPECGGTLWEMLGDNLLRYRCRVGHAYTGETLLSEQGERQEAALWAAIRALEERAQLLTKLAQNAEAAGASRLISNYEERSRTALEQALVLRELLIESRTGPAIEDETLREEARLPVALPER